LLPFAALLAAIPSGCAALTNPVADAVPVRRLPEELLACAKDDSHTIPLTLLEQCTPDAYRLGPGDVLGVYVEGYVYQANLPPPVHIPPLVQIPGQRRFEPSSGSPIRVQEDGTIQLPAVGSVPVLGMTVAEAQQAVYDRYVGRDKPIKQPESARISVTLMAPRQYHVLVFRQESSAFNTGPDGFPIAASKRGTAFEVDLPAYENDVLHALSQTGGLPGLDAYNEIVILRNCFPNDREKLALIEEWKAKGRGPDPMLAPGSAGPVVCIPLRLPCGELPRISPEDVVLRSGDVVFVEAREGEYFFTGGLLPPSAHMLPRDHDLDVVEAVALVRGSLINGAFGGSNLSGNLIQPGLGGPSPTSLVVVRKTPGGGQVKVLVDLQKALNDSRERIKVQKGDLLVLQEMPEEALARWVTQTFFNFNFTWEPIRGKHVQSVLDVAAPDRLPGRLIQFQPGF
jgi:protein involved in polysaccharide export with SLBB domain